MFAPIGKRDPWVPKEFDALPSTPHLRRAIRSGMKTILFASLLGLVSGFLCRADVIVPKPTYLTVTNLAAFPKYKFSYTDDSSSEPNNYKPLKSDRSYEIHYGAELFVQAGNGAPQPWQSIRAERDVRYLTIAVQNVQQKDNHKIVVVHKDSVSATPPKKTTADRDEADPHRSSAAFFALTGFGACGLVVLARRRSRAA